MFGDEKTQAPREDTAPAAKSSENHSAAHSERTRSQGKFEFTDWASI